MRRWRTYHWELRFAAISAIIVGLTGFALAASGSAFISSSILKIEGAETQASLDPLLSWLSAQLQQAHGTALPHAYLSIVRAHVPFKTYTVEIALPSGRIVLATNPRLVGTLMPSSEPLADSMSSGPYAEIERVHDPVTVDTIHFGQAIRVYIPIVSGKRLIGLVRLSRSPAALFAQEAAMRRTLLTDLAAGLLGLWITIYLLSRRMFQTLRKKNTELVTTHRSLNVSLERVDFTVDGTVHALALAIEGKDSYVAGHIERVALYADQIAEYLGVAPEERRIIRRGAIMHDVGKLVVPDQILQKEGPLTPDEWTVMRSHAAAGERIVEVIPDMEAVGRIIRAHHERWDGQGYPDGLSADSIPLGARIVAVADAFDAMTTDRSYRSRQGYADALLELEKKSGTQFDPSAVSAFLGVVSTMGGRGPMAANKISSIEMQPSS